MAIFNNRKRNPRTSQSPLGQQPFFQQPNLISQDLGTTMGGRGQGAMQGAATSPGRVATEVVGNQLQSQVQGATPVGRGTPSATPVGGLRAASSLALREQVGGATDITQLPQQQQFAREGLQATLSDQGELGSDIGLRQQFDLQQQQAVDAKAEAQTLQSEARRFGSLLSSLSPEQLRNQDFGAMLQAARAEGKSHLVPELQELADRQSAGTGKFDLTDDQAREAKASAAEKKRLIDERAGTADALVSRIRSTFKDDPAKQKAEIDKVLDSLSPAARKATRVSKQRELMKQSRTDLMAPQIAKLSKDQQANIDTATDEAVRDVANLVRLNPSFRSQNITSGEVDAGDIRTLTRSIDARVDRTLEKLPENLKRKAKVTATMQALLDISIPDESDNIDLGLSGVDTRQRIGQEEFKHLLNTVAEMRKNGWLKKEDNQHMGEFAFSVIQRWRKQNPDGDPAQAEDRNVRAMWSLIKPVQEQSTPTPAQPNITFLGFE